MTAPKVDGRQVLAFRMRQHQLGPHRSDGDVALLDYGVQDTGPDGAAWALAVRGGDADPGRTAWAWTLRAAPHAYRRADLGAIAVATSPYSEADAAKRIFDASKPLKAAGIPVLDALKVVARELRTLAARPIVKGDASGALNDQLEEPYLRFCRPCDAVHIYEMPFRLAALQAGLELEPGTSPPMLRRVPKLRPANFGHSGAEAAPRFDVIRNHLRFFGPATAKDMAAYVDMPVAEVKAHWPDDAVEVEVTGVPAAARFVLDEHVDDLRTKAPPTEVGQVMLLGPYDPYLQLRGRETLVDDPARRKELWPVLGRPGAIVGDGGAVIATWRPKTAGKKLTVRLQPWARLAAATRTSIEARAAELAAFRGVELAGVVDDA